MAVSAKSSRNLGIDLLRALAMFFVICQHILGQGGLVAYTQAGTGKYYFLCFLQIASSCAVDAYGITTGYLMCTKSFRLSRLTKLWLTTVFWSVAVSCCFFVFVPESRTISEMVSMFLPVLRGRYWFFTAYFVTILVSPVLNMVVCTLSKRQFKLLFAALFLVFGVVPVCSLGYDVMRISGGNHFSWMIGLYLIGGYIRVRCPQGGDNSRKRHPYLPGYCLFVLMHLLYIFATQMAGLGNWSGLFMTNVSPLIAGETICLFLYCREAGEKISDTSLLAKLICFVTPGIYSVYIIHVHPKVFWSQELIALLRPWDSWNGVTVFLGMTAAAAAVFSVCILLDKVRQWLFRGAGIDRTVQKFSDWAESLIRKFLADK